MSEKITKEVRETLTQELKTLAGEVPHQWTPRSLSDVTSVRTMLAMESIAEALEEGRKFQNEALIHLASINKALNALERTFHGWDEEGYLSVSPRG